MSNETVTKVYGKVIDKISGEISTLLLSGNDQLTFSGETLMKYLFFTLGAFALLKIYVQGEKTAEAILRESFYLAMYTLVALLCIGEVNPNSLYLGSVLDQRYQGKQTLVRHTVNFTREKSNYLAESMFGQDKRDSIENLFYIKKNKEDLLSWATAICRDKTTSERPDCLDENTCKNDLTSTCVKMVELKHKELIKKREEVKCSGIGAAVCVYDSLKASFLRLFSIEYILKFMLTLSDFIVNILSLGLLVMVAMLVGVSIFFFTLFSAFWIYPDTRPKMWSSYRYICSLGIISFIVGLLQYLTYVVLFAQNLAFDYGMDTVSELMNQDITYSFHYMIMGFVSLTLSLVLGFIQVGLLSQAPKWAADLMNLNIETFTSAGNAVIQSAAAVGSLVGGVGASALPVLGAGASMIARKGGSMLGRSYGAGAGQGFSSLAKKERAITPRVTSGPPSDSGSGGGFGGGGMGSMAPTPTEGGGSAPRISPAFSSANVGQKLAEEKVNKASEATSLSSLGGVGGPDASIKSASGANAGGASGLSQVDEMAKRAQSDEKSRVKTKRKERAKRVLKRGSQFAAMGARGLGAVMGATNNFITSGGDFGQIKTVSDLSSKGAQGVNNFKNLKDGEASERFSLMREEMSDQEETQSFSTNVLPSEVLANNQRFDEQSASIQSSIAESEAARDTAFESGDQGAYEAQKQRVLELQEQVKQVEIDRRKSIRAYDDDAVRLAEIAAFSQRDASQWTDEEKSQWNQKDSYYIQEILTNRELDQETRKEVRAILDELESKRSTSVHGEAMRSRDNIMGEQISLKKRLTRAWAEQRISPKLLDEFHLYAKTNSNSPFVKDMLVRLEKAQRKGELHR